MTENEQRFLELQLKLSLGKLRRNMDQVPLEVLKTTYREPYKSLQRQIRELGFRYINSIIFEGTDGYILLEDKTSMFSEIERAANCPEGQAGFRQALFEKADLEMVKLLSFQLNDTIQRIVRKYQSRAGREQKNGTEKQTGKRFADIVPAAENR